MAEPPNIEQLADLRQLQDKIRDLEYENKMLRAQLTGSNFNEFAVFVDVVKKIVGVMELSYHEHGWYEWARDIDEIKKLLYK